MTLDNIQLSPSWAKPGDEIIATCDPSSGQILLYHHADWERVITKINNQVQTNKKLLPLRHFILGLAEKLIVDHALCVTLPSTLVHRCSVNKDSLRWVEK